MLKFPYVPIQAGQTTDKAIQARMDGYFAEQAIASPEPANPADISVLSDSDKEMKRLLVSIAEDPLLGIAERYRKVQLNPRSGNEGKQRLIELDFVKEVNIKTSKSRIKLLDLTDKGKEELKEYGFSRSLRHGGIEHLYWMR